MSVPNPQSLIPNPELDSLVRRVDQDRWLASRFAPADVRAELVALYAVNYEIARTSEVVREAPLGEIRLQWWREALEEMAASAAVRQHPALQALASTFPAAARGLQEIAEARLADLAPAPFQTWPDVERYVDATAGALMRLAVDACAPGQGAALEAHIKSASLAWGLVGLARAAPFLEARSRSVYPREDGAHETLLTRATAAHAALRALPRPPAIVFAALGYVSLLPGYLRGLRSGGREPPLLARQARLIVAAATGRL